ncbi:hypothetical protein [Klebsiella pneumoniae]|uniref:hypothetical protein n=1 Tax=Klebsiella pneumoniae TaxID=573 RepID=UPI001CB6F35C|nr:hypothetical protein [Klebsiella pneumoniae]
MTSKFNIDNRELLQRISCGEAVAGIDFGNLIVRELAAFRLVAMDSEPVAVIDQANLDYLRSGADADVWPPEREEMGDVLLYRNAQPAPVVPKEWAIADAVKFCNETGRQDAGAAMDAWNACRAAMLQAGTLTNEGTKQAWTGIPDIDNAINMLDRIDTLESCDDDRVEAVKTVLRRLAGNSPAIPDGYVMVPINMTTEQMRAVQRDSTLGTFASAHLKGAFDLYREFWSVAVAASPQEVRKSNVVDTYQGADGKEHEIIYLTSSQKEVK